MKVGIYSGSFDPIHEGHIAFALEAADSCGLDIVYFLIEPRPRHKQGVKAYEHRAEMVRLAVANHTKLGSLLVDQDRFSVLETWPVLRARFEGSELFMLMGDDVFRHLSHWPMVDQLITSAHFIVGVRKGGRSDLQQHLRIIEQTRGLRLRYETFVPSGSRYSSTAIRRTLRQGHRPDGLSEEVVQYITAQGLYRTHAPADSAT